MENALKSSLLADSNSTKMQLGPFNPQVQDSKSLSIHSLHASAFRLRYAGNYPRFPAHLIQHLQPQLFPGAMDQRIHFTSGAFRPFGVTPTQNKLFPSAFAPPLKADAVAAHDSIQESSSGAYAASAYYKNEAEEEPTFRSNAERDLDFQTNDSNLKSEKPKSATTPTPSPQSLAKDEKIDGINGKMTEGIDAIFENRNLRRGKVCAESSAGCPICGATVLLGEVESHFFKELEKLSQLSFICRDKKYIHDKYHELGCFSSFGNSPPLGENGHGSESAIPRGRWETYQRIKSNRLGRLRIKNRKKKSGDPVCPVCNEKIQGSVENINFHVEHCLRKHSDEVEDEEEENIDVEGDSEVYGEYEWTGRHLIRATTFLVGGFAAGLLSTASSSSRRQAFEKEGAAGTECEESSCTTPVQLSDTDAVPSEDDGEKEKNIGNQDRNNGQSRIKETAVENFQSIKTNDGS